LGFSFGLISTTERRQQLFFQLNFATLDIPAMNERKNEN
jgi:transcriptional regulator of acetoin/glycerol metabolism